MFEDGRLTGFFDFYFAGVDSWLFDIAVCLNDWARGPAHGRARGARARAFVRAYGPCDRCPRPSASCCPPCCAPARCASGSRACGTSTCRARLRCSSRTRVGVQPGWTSARCATLRSAAACCSSGLVYAAATIGVMLLAHVADGGRFTAVATAVASNR